MNRIFLSHGIRDGAFASALESSIEALGTEVFNPSREIDAGMDWRKSINTAIKRSDVVLALIGAPDATPGGWVSYELGMAEAAGKQVVLLAPENFTITDLPAELSGEFIITYKPGQPDKTAREVLRRLAR